MPAPRRAVLALLLAAFGCTKDDSGEGSSGTATTSASESGPGSETTDGCAPEPVPNPEYLCCDGAWIDPRSDLFNCGECDNACTGATPFCDQGTCGTRPCAPTIDCAPDTVCCGEQCCAAGQICCTLNGPIESGPGCVDAGETGNCPAGCAPLCKCAAPETLIATPDSERPIASLSAGDLVYSVDGGAIVAVPIARVQRVAVTDHEVTRVVLDDGRTVRMTPTHPLADGRAFGAVEVGERLGDARVIAVERVSYGEPFTHDILPMSSSGAYFVAGELVASTMR